MQADLRLKQKQAFWAVVAAVAGLAGYRAGASATTHFPPGTVITIPSAPTR